MNSVDLSARLQAVADMVKKGARVADIGSDHAYLPCYLVKEGISDFAIAGEVVKGPYEHAVNEVKSRQLEDKITVRFGDGLAVLQASDNINTVTICGMGGELITKILKEGHANNKLNGTETLILQANVKEKILRTYLMSQGYEIINEAIVRENGKIYEIIQAIPVGAPFVYSQKELTFGPILLQSKSDVFREKWEAARSTNRYIVSQMEKSKESNTRKLEELQEQLKLIEEVLF